MDQRLDVAVRRFDPGLAPDLSEPAVGEEAPMNTRGLADLRKAEAIIIAVQLRDTLQSTAVWGAVRVVPASVQGIDLIVDGRIIESSDQHLELAITVRDAAGRVWIDDRHYSHEAASPADDPFSKVYAAIASDLEQARAQRSAAQLREVRQISAQQWAASDSNAQRAAQLAQRDAAVLDALDGGYRDFYAQIQPVYDELRRSSAQRIDKARRARTRKPVRKMLGAAASLVLPTRCNEDTGCRGEGPVHYGAAGGVTVYLADLKKHPATDHQAQTLGALLQAFESGVADQVIEIEDRRVRLRGNADEQYRQWRQIAASIDVQ
jgi:hypothetical protein